MSDQPITSSIFPHKIATTKPSGASRAAPGQEAGVSDNDIRLLLEWAGMKLLSLPTRSIGPSKSRSSWPQIPTYYSHSDQLNLLPTNHDVDLIDEIYEFITLIPEPITRRILQSRSLITPLSHKYLITWSRLGRLLSCDRRRVQVMHSEGISTIHKHLPNNLSRFQHLLR